MIWSNDFWWRQNFTSSLCTNSMMYFYLFLKFVPLVYLSIWNDACWLVEITISPLFTSPSPNTILLLLSVHQFIFKKIMNEIIHFYLNLPNFQATVEFPDELIGCILKLRMSWLWDEDHLSLWKASFWIQIWMMKWWLFISCLPCWMVTVRLNGRKINTLNTS